MFDVHKPEESTLQFSLSKESYQFIDYYSDIPKYSDVFLEIDEVILSRHIETCGALLIGPPGSGKTTLCRQYIKTRATASNLSEREFGLYVESPGSSITELLTEILRALHDIAPEKGTIASKQHRIITLINNLDIKVVFLDEIQVVLPASRLLPTAKILKIIKGLVNKTNCAWVLSGVPESAQILAIDAQVSDRFTRTFALTSFSMIDIESTLEFFEYLIDVLKKVERKMSFFSCLNDSIDENDFVTKTDIDSDNLLRFLLATGGKPRKIRQLLCECIHNTKPTQKINLPMMAELFERVFSTEFNKSRQNPFLTSIKNVKKQLVKERLYA
jgi:predicted AAA+ superfamily ATPase